MSQIKLLHSGGNGVVIAAPDSNPASDRTLKLPSNADGTVLTTTNPKAGNIIQVVQAIKTDLYSTSSTSSFSDVPSLSLTITPASASNKIFIVANMTHNISAASDFAYRLLRGSTALGNSTVGSEGTRFGLACGTNDGDRGSPVCLSFLDSPNTTSATTYKIQVNHQNGTYRLNSRQGQWDGSSTITAMEVAA